MSNYVSACLKLSNLIQTCQILIENVYQSPGPVVVGLIETNPLDKTPLEPL